MSIAPGPPQHRPTIVPYREIGERPKISEGNLPADKPGRRMGFSIQAPKHCKRWDEQPHMTNANARHSNDWTCIVRNYRRS